MRIAHPVFDPACRDDWIGGDKVHHFTYSALLVCAGTAGSHAVLQSGPSESIRIGMGFSLSTGLLKEIRDMRQPHNHFCWKDITADLLGIAFGMWIMESWR